MKQRKNPFVYSQKRNLSDHVDDNENAGKTRIPNSRISPRNVFLICLGLRMSNALLVQTYFNPDEHWQALEVAHRIAFGYGHLTWEWQKGIRSYLHPVIFSMLYKVLAFLNLDSPLLMVKAPRLLQSIISAVGDLYLYKLSTVVFGEYVAKWALFAQLANWFIFFCITRTFSNNLETVLTLASLYYWPCIRGSSSKKPAISRIRGLALAALACALRPTSAITWLYVGLLELLVTRHKLKLVFFEVIPIGGSVLGVTLLLDRLMYGSWGLVPLNFLKFNFLSSGGDYYGTHPWHWYFPQGFTVMVFTFLPFSIAGIVMSKERKLSGLIVWVLGVYSVLGHKEFRFVLLVLPIALMFSGYAITRLGTVAPSHGKNGMSRSAGARWPSKKQLAVAFIIATNVPMALYMRWFTRYRQIYSIAMLIINRGTEDVMYDLAKRAANGEVTSVIFLTPCHATPYYSTLHRDIPMRFLDCTPSENGALDESDKFLMDPVGFTNKFAKNWSTPSHIVLFDSQEKLLKEFLASLNFQEMRRFFHAHFKVDRELQASVVLYAVRGR